MIFQVILSKKTRQLQSISQRQMRRGEGYQQNPFWSPRRPLRQSLAMSDIYFYFISAMPQFWGAGAKGSKMQNFPLLKTMHRKSKVVYHIKKINVPSQLGGEI